MRGCTYHDILLMNLRGEIEDDAWDFLPRAMALEELRKLTRQDFGEDADRWQEWLQLNEPDMLLKFEPKAGVLTRVRRWWRGEDEA
jgi:hypothetical protein